MYELRESFMLGQGECFGALGESGEQRGRCTTERARAGRSRMRTGKHASIHDGRSATATKELVLSVTLGVRSNSHHVVLVALLVLDKGMSG